MQFHFIYTASVTIKMPAETQSQIPKTKRVTQGENQQLSPRLSWLNWVRIYFLCCLGNNLELQVTSDVLRIHPDQTSFNRGGESIGHSSELDAVASNQIRKDSILLLILVCTSSQNQTRSLTSFYAPVSELLQTAMLQLTVSHLTSLPWRTPKK